MFRWFFAVFLSAPIFAQVPAKVDFAHDVQPILRQNCIGCHGPNMQKNGMRVDQRSSVMKPGSRRVMPGSVENSFLYHRIAGPSEFGIQMPPTGPLKPEQIETIKRWIEQGAEWPDALANDTPLPPIDPKAVAMVEALRKPGGAAFEKMVAQDAKLLNARGPEGSTPFMYAVLYTNAAMLERLLKQGADPNRKNDAGGTALMWAATDLEKTRVLVSHGADVNAKSADFRTPLMVAAARRGNSATVKYLLAHKANPNPGTNPDAESTPLIEASMAGDAASMQALLDAGASYKDVAGYVMVFGESTDCAKCIEMMTSRKPDAKQYTIALSIAAIQNDPQFIKMLIDHGADVNAPDPTGRTPLMYAAVSDLLPAEQVKMMIEKGAKLNATSQHFKSGDSGMTALDLARMHGHTPVVDVLMKAGAAGGVRPNAAIEPAVLRRGNTIQQAVAASLPLLQRTDASFPAKTGCFSCHNDSITAMAVGIGRKQGFRVNEQISAQQVQVNAAMLTGLRDLLHQGVFSPMLKAGPAILSYVLLGMDAEGYKPDLSTDAVAMYLLSQQALDGSWPDGPETRPPICSPGVGQTVLAMRGLQLYTPNVNRAAYAKSIQMAANWIAVQKPLTNYDIAWKLLGVEWGGKTDAIASTRGELLAAQRPDGGWGDLPSMESGAFTTGLALMALNKAGMPASDRAYQRGVEYLLSTQLEDGSWHVRTRAAGFQPYFDNGFPHGVDQFISSAATGWATIALELAEPARGPRTVAGER